MEINSDVRIAAANTTMTESVSEQTRVARPAEGTVITGEISDLTTDTVTIATPDGSVTANLRGGPIEAKIGDVAAFTVKYDAAGNPVLELNRMPKEMIQKADVSDALVAAGFKASPENISMALELLKNGLPLSKENLLKMNQALKLLGPDKIAEALFILKNNLKIGPRTAETLEKLLTGEAKLLGQINSLEEKIAGLKDPGLKEQLSKLFQKTDPAGDALREIASEASNATGNPEKIMGKLIKAFRELAPGDLGKLTDGLLKMIDSSKGSILNKPEFAEALAKELVNTEAGASVPMKDMLGGQIPGKPDLNLTGVNPGAEKTSGMEKTVVGNEFGLETAVRAANINSKELITELFSSKTNFFKMLDENIGGFEQLREQVKNGVLNPDKPEDILKLLKLPIKPEELSPNELSYITEKLMGEVKAKDSRSALPGKLRFDPHNTEPADIDKFLGELRESLTSARSELLKHSTPEAANLMKEIADITKNIEFTAQLKNNLFIQLPVAINSHEVNAELFVFKDGKRKKKGGASTALIALDTVNLGRTETYIQKTDKTVNLQFRVKSEEVERVILQNLEKLNAGLKTYGLNLQAYSFKRLDEDFTLIKEQSELTADSADVSGKERNKKEEHMVVFDLRL